MSSTRMALASGRNYTSPTIPHMGIGSMRAHCILQERLKNSVPASHRRAFQPQIHKILDDKSRPPTLGEALTTRRNILRAANAAKRRGFNASEIDQKPLKYCAIDRPARFAVPQRRYREPVPLRFNHGLLLSEFILNDMDRRAIESLRSKRKEVENWLDSLNEAQKDGDCLKFEAIANGFMNFLDQVVPHFRHLNKDFYRISCQLQGLIDIYWPWEDFKALHRFLYSTVEMTIRSAPKSTNWELFHLLIIIKEIENFAVDASVELENMRSKEVAFQALMTKLEVEVAQAEAQRTAQPEAQETTEASESIPWGDVEMTTVVPRELLSIVGRLNNTLLAHCRMNKEKLMAKLEDDPNSNILPQDFAQFSKMFKFINDHKDIYTWDAEEARIVFENSSRFFQLITDLRSEIKRAVKGANQPKNTPFYYFRKDLMTILKIFPTLEPSPWKPARRPKCQTSTSLRYTASAPGAFGDIEMSDAPMSSPAVHNPNSFSMVGNEDAQPAGNESPFTPQSTANTQRSQSMPTPPFGSPSSSSQSNVASFTGSVSPFGSSVGSWSVSTTRSNTTASSTTSTPAATPFQPAQIEASSHAIPNAFDGAISVSSFAPSAVLGTFGGRSSPPTVGNAQKSTPSTSTISVPAIAPDTVDENSSSPSAHTGEGKNMTIETNNAMSTEFDSIRADVKNATSEDVANATGTFDADEVWSYQHLIAIFANKTFRKQFVTAITNLMATIANKSSTDTRDTAFLRRTCSYITIASSNMLISRKHLMEDQPVVNFKHQVLMLRRHLAKLPNTDYNHEVLQLEEDIIKVDGILRGEDERTIDLSKRRIANLKPRSSR